MSFTLGEITELNPKMADINDVQLSWYPDDKRNAQLCEFYIWSSHSVGMAKPSIELLEKVREAFLMTSSPRRFIFRATYGHGKTHLALALANFFGRSADAPEVASILGQLRASSPAKAEGFAAFKEERAPYLVVRLFGENVSNLPQAVVAALEAALQEKPASADYQLDFWFDKALGNFEKFGAEQIEHANEFLATCNTDFPTLCQRLRDRDGDSFEISSQLIEEIVGFAPNFGRAVELDKLIVKVTADLCGEGKPFSGLLILFDEFSAFTRSYAQDYVLKRGTPLQSLLDGVGNCGNLAAIVALSQYDPNSDLQAIFQRLGASADDRQNIEKELNRLPEPNRYQLYSSLELVLSNLLRQDDANWESLTADAKVWEQIEDATNETMRLYDTHYSEEMEWGDEKVQTILTKGCFPFHPLTIAILCKSNLRGDEAGARTVMGYLSETFRERENAPAIQNGVLNWVSPVSLVEKFEHAIVFDDILWGQYSQALRNAGAEAPDAQKSALRAMLLHEVVGLKVSREKGAYERNVAVLTGLSLAQAEQSLKELFDAGYLKRDDTRNVYAFWPMGEDGSKVEGPLQQEVTATLNDSARLKAILEKAVANWGWDAQEVAGAPGHPQDWSAEMWIMPRALFSAEKLRELAQAYRIEKLAIQEAPRGIVISLVATTNEDLAYFKTNAEPVLDEALAGMKNPPPLVLRVPQWLQGDFVKMLVREQVLLGWDGEKKREVGAKPYEGVLESTRKDIQKNHDDYNTDSYLVPFAYRAVVDAKSIGGQLMSLPNLLKTCYDSAYRGAPPFFTQDKLATAALKKATKTACEFFLRGTFAGWDADNGVQNAGKTRALFDTFLVESGGNKSWGIVDVSRRICEPKSGKLRDAWTLLEAAIPPGAENADVTPVILALMNPPWGYDLNTVSLLLCAWSGFHQSQLEVQTSSGRVSSLRECLSSNADFKKFLEDVLCVKQLRFTRRDAAETKKTVEETIEKIRLKSPFTRDEAKIAVAQLEIFAEDGKNEPRLIQASQSSIAQLQGDLKLAKDYSTALEDLQKKIESAPSISEALKALDEARKEIPFGCVRPERVLPTADLTAQAMERLVTVTENFCLRRESLSDIRDVNKYSGDLNTARKWFDERGLSDLRARVQTAFDVLGEREAELQSESKDAEFLASLKALKGEKGLKALRDGLAELDDYESHSPKTVVAIADARCIMQATLDKHLAWFVPLSEQLDAATSNGEFSKIYREIAHYTDRFVDSPEGKQLESFEKRIETLGKLWPKLADLNREKPKNNAELKKLDSAFEKLKENAALSDAQREHIERAQSEVDARFIAQVEAAKATLDNYQTRNENGEDAVRLKTALEGALARELAYLADEHKPQLRTLDRALQRRIDDDEIKSVEANFLKIKDATKRRECLKLLQTHLGAGA